MTKFKSKQGIVANAQALGEAEARAERARVAWLAAKAKTEEAFRALPEQPSDPLDLQALTLPPPHKDAFELVHSDEPGRKRHSARVAYYEAHQSQETARGEFGRAQDAYDELKRAADVAALGDGREALRAAIADHAEIAEAVRQTSTAIDRADTEIGDGYGRIAEAERAVEAARANEQARLIAEYKGQPFEGAVSVEQAQATLRKAQADKDRVRHVRRALDDELSGLNSRLGWRLERVKTAAQHVVKVSPSAGAFMAAYHDAERTYLRLRSIRDLLAQAQALPETQRPAPVDDGSAAMAWRLALRALLADADAPLPEIS